MKSFLCMFRISVDAALPTPPIDFLSLLQLIGQFADANSKKPWNNHTLLNAESETIERPA